MAVVRDLSVPMPDGSHLPAALALPDAVGGPAGSGSAPTQPAGTPRPAVVVIHEAVGLNPDIRRIAARFADAGYPTLAPDFLAGLGPKPVCIARFARAIGQVGRGRPYRQLAAAEAWLAARPEVAGGPIGVAGFCMGGGFALLHAVEADISVVAPFYAAVPRTDGELAGVCPVVASYGGRDAIFGRAGVRLDAALGRLGVERDVKTYPDAGHAFMSQHGPWLTRIGARLPTRNGYDQPAAEDAWRRTLAFFGRHLGAPAGG
jgi:carboxymethylenebutenolidase